MPLSGLPPMRPDTVPTHERPIMTNHDKPAPVSTETDGLVTDRKQRIEALFTRYPDITNDQRREIKAYFKTAPPLEIGLLKGDDTIRYKIAAFEQEEKRALATSPMELVVLLLVFVVAAVVCSALWDMGR